MGLCNQRSFRQYSVMAPFGALLVGIIIVGLVHTVAGHYQDKAEQRRMRAAMLRLDARTWRNPD
jgi:hypothetical protein